MEIKKELKVRLFAGDQLIAESTDAKLWGQILNVITGGTAQALVREAEGAITDSDVSTDIEKLAKALDISIEELQGACSPSKKEPYLHLEANYWETFQKNHKVRGRGGIAPLKVAGTLPALWFKYAKLGKTKAEQVRAVLGTLGLEDKNEKRTLSRCSWLQYRNKEILINPAEMSKALAVAKAYCKKQKLEISNS